MTVAVGNNKLMERLGVSFAPCHQVGTIVHVALDGNYAGHILISDLLKPNAEEAVRALKNAGVSRSVMLTGDEKRVADQVAAELGIAEAGKIRGICLALYKACAGYALSKGVIIADSKFEFGYDEAGTLTLGDELFTPDSSRFWAAESYRAGVSPKSYDKQSVRDWLIARRLAGALPGAALPVEIVRQTEALYRSCCEKITGEAFPS